MYGGVVFPVFITDGSEGHFRSPESLSSFKVIPFPLLLLISALLLTEICNPDLSEETLLSFAGDEVVQQLKDARFYMVHTYLWSPR